LGLGLGLKSSAFIIVLPGVSTRSGIGGLGGGSLEHQKAVAGRPVTVSHPGSAELPRAARRTILC